MDGLTQAESPRHLERIVIADVSPQTEGITSLSIKIQNKGGETRRLTLSTCKTKLSAGEQQNLQTYPQTSQ
jgi:hypothetical protein